MSIFKPCKQIFVKAPVSYKPLFVLLLLFSAEKQRWKTCCLCSQELQPNNGDRLHRLLEDRQKVVDAEEGKIKYYGIKAVAEEL